MANYVLNQIVRHFSDDFHPIAFEALGQAGGFSGATIIRMRCPAGLYCLRGWPPDSLGGRRLASLHRLLAHVYREGFHEIPVPVANLEGTTLVTLHGRYWQMEPWMPGTADFWEYPTKERLIRTFATLARWHQFAATFVPDSKAAKWFYCASNVRSPAVGERIKRIEDYRTKRVSRILTAMDVGDDDGFRALGRRIIELFEWGATRVLAELRKMDELRFRIQPCLRDVWHDHVLYTQSDVSGLIDFGACRAENVVTDLARLLGSLVEDDRRQWQTAISAYHVQNPLTTNEQQLMHVLDRSAVLLSGPVWLYRYYVLDELLADPERVLERMKRILLRLEVLISSM
jgi:homoserine kinase type II